MQLIIKMMKLINNLMKKILKLKEIRTIVTITSTPTSEICQFVINYRSNYSNQLIIAMKIIQIVCNGKMDETDKKIVEA